MKSTIFNLIILDESGSMTPVIKQTVSGCNETINTIISASEQFKETQEHFISIYAFQSGGRVQSRYLVKNEPPEAVSHITKKDYCPMGLTPLYDAIGETINDIREVAKTHQNSIGSVTIITDGYENDSQKFTGKEIVSIIEELKSIGWNFNFIGANIDAEEVANDLHIPNSLQFETTAKGVNEMFIKEKQARFEYYAQINEVFCSESPDKEKLKKISESYFDKSK